jgi:hypothetical protein
MERPDLDDYKDEIHHPIKVINSILFYQGKLCSYRTKKIRSFIEKVAETNDSFNLPAGYTINTDGGYAMICKTSNPK